MSPARADRAALVLHARDTIRRGSKSFAAASMLFDRPTRERAWFLYAWCRACDDLADAQDHGGTLGPQEGLAQRLTLIRELTEKTLGGEPTGNPSFDALGMVAAEAGLTPAMAQDVIAGFALDADGWRPRTEADMTRYCFHVAGAVGVMMAVVMGVSPQDKDTLARAADLGHAFQLANIARDIAEDAAAGRCYLPQDWLEQAGIASGSVMDPQNRARLASIAGRLCLLAEKYEASARIGARRLSFRQRWAVLSAAGIYGAIAREVARRGEYAWDERVVMGKGAKLGSMLRALVQAATRSDG